MHSGEIVGVAGVAGNGQRELAETIAGIRQKSHGVVRIAGRTLRGGDPREAIAAGLAYIPEDRLGTGVAPGLSIATNLGAEVIPLRLVLARTNSAPREHPRRSARPHPPLRDRRARAGDLRLRAASSREGTCRRSCWRASFPAVRD